MSRAFIPDGYTEDGFIAELKNIHEPVRFKFRPVLPEAVRALMHNYFEKTAAQQGEIVEQTLMRQVLSWDLKDHEGNDLALSVANLRRIKKPLKDRLFNIVTCYEGSDSDKDAVSATGEESKLDYDALLLGETTGEKGLADEAKN